MAKTQPAHDAHNHATCVASVLERARIAFVDKGLKLTALRLKVLEEIAGSHEAMGAYDVQDRLARRTGELLAPISVYRAIDALIEAGLVHRLESKNAFFACHAPHANSQRHVALICEKCSAVVEVPGAEIYGIVEVASRTKNFDLKSVVAEGSGICAQCRTETHRPSA